MPTSNPTSAAAKLSVAVLISSVASISGFRPLPRWTVAWAATNHHGSRRSSLLPSPRHRSCGCALLLSNQESPPAGDEDEEDWRDFRAKLVMQFQKEQKGDDDDKDSDHGRNAANAEKGRDKGWAYESGTTIEKGSVILSRSEQDFGYGLRQQYFHKCVILVLHHREGEFTKGIILNRPTDLLLSDEDFVYEDGTPLESTNVKENRWLVWFGGDVRGISSDEPEVTCLHSLTSEAANEVSEKVMKNIQWTTLAGANKLVSEGDAEPEDFWVFCGYAGWGAGQLQDELKRESWYMAATDSQTLLMELKKQGRGTDPRDAGLDTWSLLMDMIGKRQEAEESEGDFDDLMLREWAKERLVFDNDETDEDEEVLQKKFEAIANRVKDVSRGGNFEVGTILRASSSDHPPFLLEDQEFHRSVILIIQDDDAVTVGLLLNLPSALGIDFEVSDEDGADRSKRRVVTIPQRYGGRYGVKGQDEKPFVWLHCSDALREAQVGSPVGNDIAGMWSCTQEDAEVAIRMGLASPNDFMVFSGFSVWEKVHGMVGGIIGQIMEGNFEIVSPSKAQAIWDVLASQELLTAENMSKNLKASFSAWSLSAENNNNKTSSQSTDQGASEDSVQSLADTALRSWVATFLLGDPTLRSSGNLS